MTSLAELEGERAKLMGQSAKAEDVAARTLIERSIKTIDTGIQHRKNFDIDLARIEATLDSIGQESSALNELLVRESVGGAIIDRATIESLSTFKEDLSREDQTRQTTLGDLIVGEG